MGSPGKFLIYLAIGLAGLMLLSQIAQAQRALEASRYEQGSGSAAAPEEDLPAEIVERIIKMVRSHPSLSGLKAEVRVGRIRQRLADCPAAPEVAFAAPKARPWGSFSVVVRCAKPFWGVTVSVQTRVFGPQVVAKRYLAQGTRLKAEDLEAVSTDITRTPADLARSVEEVQGKILSQPLAQGATLALNILREPSVIRVGEGVRVQIQGKGFQASGEGVAVTAGTIGDSIRVRMPDGQQVSGRVIRPGVVEVVIN